MCVFCGGHSQGRVVHKIFEVDPAAVLSEIAKAAVTYCNTNRNIHEMREEKSIIHAIRVKYMLFK